MEEFCCYDPDNIIPIKDARFNKMCSYGEVTETLNNVMTKDFACCSYCRYFETTYSNSYNQKILNNLNWYCLADNTPIKSNKNDLKIKCRLSDKTKNIIEKYGIGSDGSYCSHCNFCVYEGGLQEQEWKEKHPEIKIGISGIKDIEKIQEINRFAEIQITDDLETSGKEKPLIWYCLFDKKKKTRHQKCNINNKIPESSRTDSCSSCGLFTYQGSLAEKRWVENHPYQTKGIIEENPETNRFADLEILD